MNPLAFRGSGAVALEAIPGSPEELHITSLVVHSTSKRLESVSRLISAVPGAVVHATSPIGKLVVTLEASSADEMLLKVTQIQRVDGVLAAAMVYQCADSLDAMNEVLPDDTRPA